MAALLGTPFITLRRWENAESNPSAAARKLVFVLEAIFLHPERLATMQTMIRWGRD